MIKPHGLIFVTLPKLARSETYLKDYFFYVYNPTQSDIIKINYSLIIIFKVLKVNYQSRTLNY